MEFDGIELRELEPIAEPHIPECIKTLFIDKGIGGRIEAQTTDFNSNGIRLLIPTQTDAFTRDEFVIIQPVDNSYRLVGEIRHIVQVHNETTYLGIKFYSTKSLPVYTDLIEIET